MKTIRIVYILIVLIALMCNRSVAQCTSAPIITLQPIDVTKCSNGTVTFTVNVSGATSYQWYWSGSTSSDKIVPPVAPVWTGTKTNQLTVAYLAPDKAGYYWLKATNACGTTTSESALLTVYPSPTGNLTAANSGPVCANGTLNLTASSGFSNYTWTGPNGFTSTVQNPTLSNGIAPGVYTVRVTGVEGCKESSTTVTVNGTKLTVSTPFTTCEGNAAALSAPTGLTNYSWSGPNGFTSTSNNPTVASAVTLAHQGGYTVISTTTNGSCPSYGNTYLTVKPLPTITLHPVDVTKCNGSSVVLIGSADNATSYRWCWSGSTSSDKSTPPLSPPWDGYNTNQLTISYFGSDKAGQYWLKATNSCGSRVSNVATVTTAQPVVTVSNSGAACVGGTVNLSASSGYSTYNWTGPNGYTSTTQNPIISSAAETMSGNYSLSAVDAQGCTASAITAVAVTPRPSASASFNPTCLDGSLVLNAPSGAATYLWSGPNSYSSTNPNPTVSLHATQAMAGIYTLTVTKPGNGCTNTGSTTVTFDCLTKNVDKNYITKNIIQVSGITSANNIAALGPDANNQTVQYLDGLGRPLQTVNTMGSPNKSDIVTPNVYDDLGRQAYNYLPFTAETNGLYKDNIIDAASHSYIGAAADFYSVGSNNKIADDSNPYSRTIFENSPLGRVIKQGSAGAVWQPDNNNSYASEDHTTKKSYESIAANEVLLWMYSEPSNYTFGIPIAPAGKPLPQYYGINQLYKYRTKDENLNEIIEYKDKLNRTILKRVQAVSGTPVVNNTNYASTYYIYNSMGDVVCIIPPEATSRLALEYYQSGSTDATRDAFLNKWAFRYRYDNRRRMTHKKLPGIEAIYMVYDNRDRLVLTQNGNQRLTGSGQPTKTEWSFSKYDINNRVIISGIYIHGTVVNQVDMQSHVSSQFTTPEKYYEDYNGSSSSFGYSNRAFPTGNTTVYSISYYDNYSFKNLISGTTDDYSPNQIAGQQPSESLATKGQITGTQVNILGSSSYLWTVNYYDEKYRTIQTKTLNIFNGVDQNTTVYNFTGNAIETLTTHVNGATTRTIRKRYEYDHAGRPLKVKHTYNAEPEVLLALNEYNEIGQLVTKKLHSRNNGSSFSQVIDNRYTIQGWLDNINDLDVPDDKDLFSLDLRYEDPTAKGGPNQYNGNISEMRWSSIGLDKQSYGYSYDNLSRLTYAKYYSDNAWTNGRYDEWVGDVSNNIQGYDLNGNIKRLFRWGKKDVSAYGKMDDLTYTYSGNQLASVDDVISKTNNEDGFKENVKTVTEYAYDWNGNMKKDDNKGITVTYNNLNLPVEVKKSASEYIVYTYDASGRKLRQQVFGTSAKNTSYAGDFIYENNVLQFVNHLEGRIIPANSGNSEYQYYLKDHLSNVRVVFSEKNVVNVYKANMEAATNATFNKYSNRSSFNLFDHTDAGNVYTYSQLLNGGNNSQVGLAKSLAVNAGETIDVEVFAKYEGAGSTGNNVNALLTSLVSAFGLSSTGTNAIDGSQAYNAFNSTFSAGPYIGRAASFEDDAAPKAYLNYILFDNAFNLIDFGFDQVSNGAKQVGISPIVAHDYLNLHVKVKQAGYLYIYLSNEQPLQTNVYFDDLKIVHNTGVEQLNLYYPFGLTFNNFQKPNSIKNSYQYNSKELQDELDIAWLDYGARMFSPDISRWTTIDPYADKYYDLSPYNYTLNNPVRFTDPDGKAPNDIVYFDSEGNEIYRIKSDTEFRTYVNFGYTIPGAPYTENIKEAPMPNIIQEKGGSPTTDEKYQEHDYQIAAETLIFNEQKNNGELDLVTEGNAEIPKSANTQIPDLDPTLVKAIAMQESAMGRSDVMQSNVKGDYSPFKAKYGLSQGGTTTPQLSIHAGIRILATKGFKGGISFDSKTGTRSFNFKGWERAVKNYNGGGASKYGQDYSKLVLQMYMNSKKRTIISLR